MRFAARMLCVLTALGLGTSTVAAQEWRQWVAVNAKETSDPCSGQNPRLVILPDGTFVAAVDHGVGCFVPAPRTPAVSVFRSTDRGQTWVVTASLSSPFSASMFAVGDDLYLLGAAERTQRTYVGGLVIKQSKDGGRTWSEARDRTTGQLADQLSHSLWPEAVICGGRVWRPQEVRSHREDNVLESDLVVMSAPVDADLLNADSWRTSSRAAIDDQDHMVGFLDVIAMRSGPPRFAVSCLDDFVLCRAETNSDGIELRASSVESQARLPKRAARRKVLHDPVTDTYFALTMPNDLDESRDDPHKPSTALVLMSSPDCASWSARTELMRMGDDVPIGWLDWAIDGADLVFVMTPRSEQWCSTVVFVRVPDFRGRSLASAPYWCARSVK